VGRLAHLPPQRKVVSVMSRVGPRFAVEHGRTILAAHRQGRSNYAKAKNSFLTFLPRSFPLALFGALTSVGAVGIVGFVLGAILIAAVSGLTKGS